MNYKYENKCEVGQQFGYWTVISEPLSWAANSRVPVKCKCGSKSDTSVYSLANGKSKGCSKCSRRFIPKHKNSPTWRGFEDIPGVFFSNTKGDAKKRGLKYGISPQYMWDLYLNQQRKCALTGQNIEFGKTRDARTASLDRIDSAQGYIEGNVQWVHKDINRLKNNYSQSKFITMCEMVSEYANKI